MVGGLDCAIPYRDQRLPNSCRAEDQWRWEFDAAKCFAAETHAKSRRSHGGGAGGGRAAPSSRLGISTYKGKSIKNLYLCCSLSAGR